MRKIIFLVIACITTVSLVQDFQADKLWTDQTGKFSMRAKLKEVELPRT